MIYRFDERMLLIIFGVITAIVGRAAFLPFPGVENPAICYGVPNNCTIDLNVIDPSTDCQQSFSHIQRLFEDDPPMCHWDGNNSPLAHNKNGRFVCIYISIYP